MTETICAIATPPGQGGVGIVRVSGPDAERVLRMLCPGFSAEAPSHSLKLAQAIHPDTGAVLDEVLAVVMRAPRSYTGEDVAEIQGHGGALNMQSLLEATLACGARLAAPGEFTQRAFLSGRLDLTQAEAVADIIGAASAQALKLAQDHLAGRLGGEIEALRESITRSVILTEAAIDFSTEEHVYQLDTEALLNRIDAVQASLARLLGTWDAGRQIREGVRAVILGRPNAGKSTFFNGLCGQDRAIVTAVPGTTRDYLEERVQVGAASLRLVDTAGLRESSDEVERLGVDRSAAQAAQADLILWVIDASAPLSIAPRELAALEHRGGADVLPILNKIDRPNALTDADLARIEALASRPTVAVSLLDDPRPKALLDAVETIAVARTAPAGEGAVIARQRHREALLETGEALGRAREAAENEMSWEFIALDLRLALDAVGAVVGKVTVDDVLARIFSDFCVGK